MRNGTPAERILSLVTTRDRATSTVGDLLEEASDRGAFWFWASLLRTASSYVWQDLCAARGRMLWLVFSGLLEYIAMANVLLNAVTALWMAIWPYQLGPNATYIPPWGFYGLLVALFTAAPLLVGWDVARRSRGRELAAGIALTFLFAALSAIGAVLTGTVIHRVEQPYPYVKNDLIDFCASAVFGITGALLFRLRTHAPANATRHHKMG